MYRCDLFGCLAAAGAFETLLALLFALVWSVAHYANYETVRVLGAPASLRDVHYFFDPTFDGTQSIDYSADADDMLGIIGGVEATFGNGISAFLELRALDESALALGISAGF